MTGGMGYVYPVPPSGRLRSRRLAVFVAAVLLSAFAGPPAYAACPAQPADVERAIAAAEAEAQELQAEPFHVAAALAESEMGCIQAAVPGPLVPRYLRVLGLRAYMDHDESSAAQAFAAARALEPAQAFLRDVLPEDNPFWTTYRALDVADGTYTDLAPASTGTVLLDGRPATRRPAAWPVLFQYVGDDGAVRETRLLWPGEPLPGYPHVEAAAAVGSRTVAHASRGLLAAAGVSGLLAGGLYVAAAFSRHDYEEASVLEEVESLHGRTNGLVVASLGVGAVGVGLGVVAIASGRW